MTDCVTCQHYQVREIRSGDRILTDGFCNHGFSRPCKDMRKGACGRDAIFFKPKETMIFPPPVV